MVTTCNAKGYAEYGRRMVETFLAHWPEEVPLLLFHEGFRPPPDSARIVAIDLLEASPALAAFKARHARNPKANGRARPWLRMGRLALSLPIVDSRNRFRWDAVRFAHKCYAIFEAARRTQADVLIWIDADSVFFADVSMADLDPLSPPDCAVSCLRRPSFSECGFVVYNLRLEQTREFLAEFEAMYDRDLLFLEREYHDSYLFDVIRRRAESRGVRVHDIADGAGRRAKHVLINSRLGAFMDHLKGDRKAGGASLASDLVVARDEPYWR